MKRIVTYATALMGFALLSSCAPKTYSSMKLQSSPISVDGKADEWATPLRYYDKNSKLFYEVRNDNENLYIALSANDAPSVMRLMRNGISLGLDTALGKMEYPLSISFPIHSGKPPMMGKDGKPGERPPFPPGRDSLSKRQGNPPKDRPMIKSDIKLTGFGGKEADTIPAIGNQLGIEAAIQGDMNSVFCELKIPFASFYKQKLTANDTLKALFFEATLAALSINDRPMLPKGTPDDGDDTSRPGGGMGAPPSGGGGMGGGMGAPPSGGGGGMGGMPGGMGGPGGGGRPPRPDNAQLGTPAVFRFQLRPKVN